MLKLIMKFWSNLKQPKFESEKYRRWIASLPCCVSGVEGTQAAHIRSGTGGGMGFKPSDAWCVPLSPEQHRIQHEIGETTFWALYGGIQAAKQLAQDLYEIYQLDEHERDINALQRIVKFRS
jgi:hypothetical protein